jgi:hypothetical protein
MYGSERYHQQIGIIPWITRLQQIIDHHRLIGQMAAWLCKTPLALGIPLDDTAIHRWLGSEGLCTTQRVLLPQFAVPRLIHAIEALRQRVDHSRVYIAFMQISA